MCSYKLILINLISNPAQPLERIVQIINLMCQDTQKDTQLHRSNIEKYFDIDQMIITYCYYLILIKKVNKKTRNFG